MQFNVLNIIYDPEAQKNFETAERIWEKFVWIKEHILIILLAAVLIILLARYAIKKIRGKIKAKKQEKLKNRPATGDFDKMLSENGLLEEENSADEEVGTKP